MNKPKLSILIILLLSLVVSGCLKSQTLVNENQAEGKHSVVWDGKDDSGRKVSQGVYFYQLKAGNEFSNIKKLLFFKTGKEY